MTDGPRVRPGGRREVGALNWIVAAVSGVVAGTGPPHLFLTLGRHRRLFRGWLRFAGRLMPGGSLPRRETELVILRVAHLRSCDYELDHHARLARRAGVTGDDVARVTRGPGDPAWPERERAVLAAADALVERHDLDDEAWRQLRRHLDDRQAIELCLLVGHYDMLATTIRVLRVEPDPPVRRMRLPTRRRAGEP